MAKRGPSSTDRPAAGADPVPSPAVAEPAAPGDPPQPVGEEQLVTLFMQIRDELVSTLMYLLGNPDDAEDAAQEAFMKCLRAKQSLPDVQNLRAWIFRVGLNAAKDFQRSAWNRRSRPLPEDDLMIPVAGDGPGQSVEDQETLERLREAITHLRQEEKEVFLLRQNGDLTYEQIAEVRGAPVGTVKTQMRSALQKLRKVLNPEPSGESAEFGMRNAE
jgi:RNA polymerase sigma-70 factor (ECF subfamily)